MFSSTKSIQNCLQNHLNHINFDYFFNDQLQLTIFQLHLEKTSVPKLYPKSIYHNNFCVAFKMHILQQEVCNYQLLNPQIENWKMAQNVEVIYGRFLVDISK